MLSQAEVMALAWPKAPATTATVITAPPTISDSLNREARAGSTVWAASGLKETIREKSNRAKVLPFFVM
jgi:hypothetical protein